MTSCNVKTAQGEDDRLRSWKSAVSHSDFLWKWTLERLYLFLPHQLGCQCTMILRNHFMPDSMIKRKSRYQKSPWSIVSRVWDNSAEAKAPTTKICQVREPSHWRLERMPNSIDLRLRRYSCEKVYFGWGITRQTSRVCPQAWLLEWFSSAINVLKYQQMQENLQIK